MPLTAAEIQSAFRHHRFIASLQRHNIIMDAGIHGSLYHVCRRNRFIEHGNVFPDGPGHLEHVLIHRGQGIYNDRTGDLPAFYTVKQNLAGPFLVKPRYQLRKSALAAAGGSYHGSPAPRFQMQVKVLEEGRIQRTVAKADILHGHFAGKAVPCKGNNLIFVRVVQGVRFIAPHIVQTAHLHFRILQHVAQGQQLLHRLPEFGDQVVKGHINTGSHDAFHDGKTAHRHDQGCVKPAQKQGNQFHLHGPQFHFLCGHRGFGCVPGPLGKQVALAAVGLDALHHHQTAHQHAIGLGSILLDAHDQVCLMAPHI